MPPSLASDANTQTTGEGLPEPCSDPLPHLGPPRVLHARHLQRWSLLASPPQEALFACPHQH